jgi:hypothetical protein
MGCAEFSPDTSKQLQSDATPDSLGVEESQTELVTEPIHFLDSVAERDALATEEIVEAQFRAFAVRKALSRLPDRERTILTMRTGFFGEPETLASIGRHLGRSGTRVRQLESSALFRLSMDKEIAVLVSTPAEEREKNDAIIRVKTELARAEARIEDLEEELIKNREGFPLLVTDSLESIGVTKIQKIIAEHRLAYILSQERTPIDYGAAPKFEMRSTILCLISNALDSHTFRDDHRVSVLEGVLHDVSRAIKIPLHDDQQLYSWLVNFINQNVAKVKAEQR